MSAVTENIRRIVRRFRAEELGIAPEELLPAEAVLAECDRVTGYDRRPMPTGDPLLSGAYAVLDRMSESIWLDLGRSAQKRAFDAAHEYGHLVLHDAREACPSLIDDGANPESGLTVGATAKVEGYSPQQRREAEANIFASELLAPAEALRTAYFSGDWDLADCAIKLGVSTRFLRGQLQYVVLRTATEAPGAEMEAAASGPPSREAVTVSLDDLDPSQREAALRERGPYLLGAGPGTGKTRTLVARCVHLVEDRGVRPESILALTFSRKAAEEMRERLIAAGVGSERAGPWIGTFHSFGLELLRRYGDRVGLRQDWRLLDQTGAFLMLERNIERLALDELSQLALPSVYLRDILSAISRAKDELCPPDRHAELAGVMLDDACDELRKYRSAARAAELSHAYSIYEELLTEENAVDFGDLIVKPVRILREFPDIRQDLVRQYPHVLADEYQDVNRACARLLQLVAGESGEGLWVVGDNRQSIYRFRGASPANIHAFGHDFEGAERGELAVNYRSRAEIVHLFEILARRMNADGTVDPAATSWQSRRGRQEPDKHPALAYAVADDEDAQADGIAGAIKAFHDDDGYAFGDQAILCRTHKQASRLAAQLAERDVPVSYAGKLFDRPQVRDLLAVIAATSCSRRPASIALMRVASLPEYGIGHDRAAALARYAAASTEPFAKAIVSFGREEPGDPLPHPLPEAGRGDDPPGGDAEALRRLSATIGALERTTDPVECLEQFLFESSRYMETALDLRAAPTDFAAAVAICAIRQLLSVARSVCEVAPPESPDGAKLSFMGQVRRMVRMNDDPQVSLDEIAANRDVVRMITAHAAKGLEFPIVFLPNLSDGKFPTSERTPFIPEPPGMTEVDESCPKAWRSAGEGTPPVRPGQMAGIAEGLPGQMAGLQSAENPSGVTDPHAAQIGAADQQAAPSVRAPIVPVRGAAAANVGVRDEELCLFFVALSRAREHLVLSRAERYGTAGKEAEPSELLGLVEGALAELGVKPTRWSRPQSAPVVAPLTGRLDLDGGGETEDVPARPAARRTYWMTELEQYQRCPRQYYYTRILKLGRGDIEPASSVYAALGTTVRWMYGEWEAGTEIGEETVAEQFDLTWKRLSEIDLPEMTRTRALALLEKVRSAGPEPGLTLAPEKMRLYADLEDVRVGVIPDLLATDSRGSLIVARNRYGRPQDDDHKSPRLAIFRRAAQDTSPDQSNRVELRYLASGNRRPVAPSSKWEPGRVEKYNRAALGIGRSEYSAQPSREEMCATCPYYFLCPK